MIGALRYFASRFLAPRYWPKVGAGTVTLFPTIYSTALVSSDGVRRMADTAGPRRLTEAV